MFLNGAKSQEGRNARISRVEGQSDLDQFLGARPSHVQEVIDHLLEFTPTLAARDITLTADTIVAVEELQRFVGMMVRWNSDSRC